MSGRKEEVTEKLSEPFEYFSFVEKPFDKRQLVAAIKDAMAKAKKHPVIAETPTVSTVAESADTSAMAEEIQKLNNKIAKMNKEIETLKKQLNQIVGFIKKKLSK